MAPVDESGFPDPVEDASGQPAERWRGTYLDAAIDAAAGLRWLRDDAPGSDAAFSRPLYASQRNWLSRFERLFGLTRDQAASVVEALRLYLGVSLTAHTRARRQAGRSRLLRERGRALVQLLAVLTMDSELWDRLLTAGHLAGLWPEPWVWDPAIRQFRFPSRGPALRPAARSPPVASSTSALAMATGQS